MGRVSNGPIPNPYVPLPTELVGGGSKVAQFAAKRLGIEVMPWTIVQLRHEFYEWKQTEHNMYGRRAAWSPLWWWSCSLISISVCVNCLWSCQFLLFISTHFVHIVTMQCGLRTCSVSVIYSKWPLNAFQLVCFVNSSSMPVFCLVYRSNFSRISVAW